MLVQAGSTDVTTYFHLRLAADGTDATGLTITNIDLQYVRNRTAPAAKADATALAATDSAHGDNQAIEIDATDQPGVYRVDWPDAAFASGVPQVVLTVKCATAFTESLRVQLTGFDPTVALATASSLSTVSSNVDAILVDTGTTLQAELDGIQADTEDIQSRLPTALVGGRIDASVGAMAADVMTAAAAASDLTTELQSGLATASVVSAIKAKTDNLTFGTGTALNANITHVNETEVGGTGADGNEWGPA